MTGRDGVSYETWFEKASATGRAARAVADPLNLRVPAPSLEVRRHFFSQRVQRTWNELPAELKNAATVSSFRRGYNATGMSRDPMTEITAATLPSGSDPWGASQRVSSYPLGCIIL